VELAASVPKVSNAARNIFFALGFFVLGFALAKAPPLESVFGKLVERPSCVLKSKICVGADASILDRYSSDLGLGGVETLYCGFPSQDVGPISAIIGKCDRQKVIAFYSKRGMSYAFEIVNGKIWKITVSSKMTLP
jgi:hypothetical protein